MKAKWIMKCDNDWGNYSRVNLYETYDGGFTLKIDGKSDGTVDIGNNIILNGTGTFSIKYDSKGIPQWAIVGNYEEIGKLSSNEYIASLIINEQKTLDLGNNLIINGPGNFIIKYDENNVAQEVVLGEIVDMVGYGWLAGASINIYPLQFGKNIDINIILEEKTTIDLGEGLIINGPGIFNVSFENKTVTDITNSNFQEIKTEDGGTVKYGSINQDFKNRLMIIHRNNNYVGDGIIIKYDKDNNIEWFKIIGGELSDEIVYAMQTEDKGFLAVARFESLGTINLGNGNIIENDSPSYDMIKFDNLGNIQWCSNICNFEQNSDDILILLDSNYFMVNQVKEIDGKYIIDLNIDGKFTFGDIEYDSDSGDTGIATLALDNAQINLMYGTRLILQYTPVEKNEDNPIVEYAKNVEGNLDDSTELVKETKDGDYYTVSEKRWF